MKNLFVILCMFTACQAMAQSSVYRPSNRFLEAGFLFGLTNYSGDLAEKNVHLSETHLGYGIYGLYHFSKYFALKAHVYSGAISGDDANAKDPTVVARSFRFATDILEVGLVGEWHFLGRERTSSTGIQKFSLSPYVYLGIGGTFSGARAEYYGPPEGRDIYFVVPLPENGLHQRFLLAPMGVGVRTDINEVMAVGLELGWRPVFSDDLDGVRYNGNPESNDWYYFGGATVSFVLGRPKKH